MLSQRQKLKNRAITLRKRGLSYGEIESKLGIAKSTLSYWLPGIALTERQKARIRRTWFAAIAKARIKAVKWHNLQKKLRLEAARNAALETLGRIDISDKDTLDIALAMLYLGEGSKSQPEFGLGNTNPLILKFFLRALQLVYSLDTSKVRCELHLRADQNKFEMQKYWSKELAIPLKNFTSVAFDPRTKVKRPILIIKVFV